MAIQAQLYSDNSGFPLVVGSQDWIDNACGFNEYYFNLPQKQQIAQQPHQFINLPQNGVLLPKNNKNSYQSIALSAQIEKQRQEIDRFITLQNQKLILALEEQRKQEVAMLLRKYESNTHFLMKQKDEEIAKAAQRTMELEDFLRRVEFESQTWQRVAKENEAMVINLNNKIEELRENACFSNEVEDAESCCDNRGDTQTEEYRGHENEEQRTRKKMGCKICNSRNSCVVLLPCRHLCSCEACVAFLDSCPVCGMPKKAIIEALV